jgi:hypothetical protein
MGRSSLQNSPRLLPQMAPVPEPHPLPVAQVRGPEEEVVADDGPVDCWSRSTGTATELFLPKNVRRLLRG